MGRCIILGCNISISHQALLSGTSAHICSQHSSLIPREMGSQRATQRKVKSRVKAGMVVTSMALGPILLLAKLRERWTPGLVYLKVSEHHSAVTPLCDVALGTTCACNGLRGFL